MKKGIKMKKLLLIPALLAGSLALADGTRTYEISPMIGYNIVEGNTQIRDNGYLWAALEGQYNFKKSNWSAELALMYSDTVLYKPTASGPKSTDIFNISTNAVYTFRNDKLVAPFLKAGIGYDVVSNTNSDNRNGMFVDAGAGLRLNFTDWFALKAEAIYMAKVGASHDVDNALTGLIGMTFSFGGEGRKAAPKAAVAPIIVKCEQPAPVVIPAPVVVPVPAPVVAVDGDDDKDGIHNSEDYCPNTPLGSYVNIDGCSKIIPLINFEFNSYKIKDASTKKVAGYANFLKEHTDYSAKIVGHTDSKGSAEYNQKLSEKRAESLGNLLISAGVPSEQVKTEGRGENNPIYSNETEKGRAANRRIEAVLTKN